LRGEVAKQLCQFSDQRAAINVRAALQSNQRAQYAKQLCQFTKQLCQFTDQRAVFSVRAALQSNQQAQHAKQLCQFAFRDRVPVVLTQDVASSSRHPVSLEAATQ
jgi:hypothetical protein